MYLDYLKLIFRFLILSYFSLNLTQEYPKIIIFRFLFRKFFNQLL